MLLIYLYMKSSLLSTFDVQKSGEHINVIFSISCLVLLNSWIPRIYDYFCILSHNYIYDGVWQRGSHHGIFHCQFVVFNTPGHWGRLTVSYHGTPGNYNVILRYINVMYSVKSYWLHLPFGMWYKWNNFLVVSGKIPTPLPHLRVVFTKLKAIILCDSRDLMVL